MAVKQLEQALGNAIASLRKEQGMTQRDLAERLHIHHSMVTRWEKGQTTPRDESLEKIALALGVTLEALLTAERKQPLRLPNPVNDPELHHLLSQLNHLDGRDLDALKVFLDAMLTKASIRRMVNAGSAAQAS